MLKKSALAACVLLLIASCSPFSKQTLRQVDTAVSFQEIQKDPDEFLNRTVLWGGTIIETRVEKNTTEIKVLQTRLDSSKRPEAPDLSAGRFIIRSEGFLDPAVYRPGRALSVVGSIKGKELLPMGEVMYSYPVIESRQMHLWEERAQYRRPLYWDTPVYPFPYDSYPYLLYHPPWPSNF